MQQRNVPAIYPFRPVYATGELILTTIDEGILGQEPTLLFLMVCVEAKDEDVVHRYEKARK